MKTRWKTLIVMGLGILILALAGLTLASQAAQAGPPEPEEGGPFQVQISSAHYKLDWTVFGTGGGIITSAHYKANTTLGQPNVNHNLTSTHYKACAGFWCAARNWFFDIFLPFIRG